MFYKLQIEVDSSIIQALDRKKKDNKRKKTSKSNNTSYIDLETIKKQTKNVQNYEGECKKSTEAPAWLQTLPALACQPKCTKDARSHADQATHLQAAVWPEWTALANSVCHLAAGLRRAVEF